MMIIIITFFKCFKSMASVSETGYITIRVTDMEDPMTADLNEVYICFFEQIYTQCTKHLASTNHNTSMLTKCPFLVLSSLHC